MAFDFVGEVDSLLQDIKSDWLDWLQCADLFYGRYVSYMFGHSPFDGRKARAVEFLGNAAAIAGHVPLLGREVPASPTTRMPSHKSRSDVWFDNGNQGYSFKVRQTRRDLNTPYLRLSLKYVMEDTRSLETGPRERSSSCLIAVARDETQYDICTAFAGHVDIACRIGPDDSPAFLFFKLKDQDV
ncbi:hypothetical protein [Novosphingobium sp. P6W]|uniref:hypothetical protein n=1 Tax=Novosphingobium sp. P6W TaxID=1609758 RepID=UPI0013B38C01|nr:hypothetical protein [Novosphingobium sp. P6W]